MQTKSIDKALPLSIVGIVVHGTAILAILLEALLITHSISSQGYTDGRAYIGLIAIAWTVSASFLIKHNRYKPAVTLTILFYMTFSLLVFLNWGINSGVGLMLLLFTIFFTAITVRAKYIPAITLITSLLLVIVFFIHKLTPMTPKLESLSLEPHTGDVMTYIGLLGIFGSMAWIASSQIQKSFLAAQNAEQKLRTQKENLADELKRESALLKANRMEETRQLYHFAEMGQASLAMLHELSNHLSILNLDIDDLRTSNTQPELIRSTKESINHINSLVITARNRIHARNKTAAFNPTTVISQVVHEIKPSILAQKTSITLHHEKSTSISIIGDEISLAHVVTILVKNARDACRPVKMAHISITTHIINDRFSFTVTDNGPGVPEHVKQNLFEPKESKKDNGLGIGLFIAKNITKTQFKGKITYNDKDGTTFTVSIPLYRPESKKD